MTMIPLASISPPAWNSRLPKTGKLAKEEAASVERLAASLKTDGQLTAIEVEKREDGSFELVFGGRRCAAARLLGWKEINAEVRAPSSASEKIARNIVENGERENLTTFELARSATQLRELGLSNNDIAPKLGVSASHVSNLNTAYKGLPAPVLKDWEQGNPVATEKTLQQLATKYKTDEEKLRAWDDILAEAAAREAETGAKPGKRGKAKKGDGGGAGLSVSTKNLGHLLTALSSKSGSPDLDDEHRKWGKALLDFVVQARTNPPAGVPPIPAKEEKATKPAKAGKK